MRLESRRFPHGMICPPLSVLWWFYMHAIRWHGLYVQLAHRFCSREVCMVLAKYMAICRACTTSRFLDFVWMVAVSNPKCLHTVLMISSTVTALLSLFTTLRTIRCVSSRSISLLYMVECAIMEWRCPPGHVHCRPRSLQYSQSLPGGTAGRHGVSCCAECSCGVLR